MRTLRRAGLGLAVLLTAACGSEEDDAPSLPPAFKPGAWTLASGECANAPSPRRPGDDVVYRSTDDFPVGLPQGITSPLLAADDPIVLAAQADMDLVYETAKTLFPPETFEGRKTPKVLVIEDDRPGAFALGGYSCFNLPVIFGEGAAPGATTFGLVGGYGQYFQTGALPCTIEPTTLETVKPAIDWLNANQTACDLSLETEPELRIRLSSGCVSPLQTPFEAAQLLLSTTSDAVLIFSGRVRRHSEGNLVATLSHELAHVMASDLARGNAGDPTLSYPYRQDTRPSVCAPAPEPALADLDLRLKAEFSGRSLRAPLTDNAVALLGEAADAHMARYTSELAADEIGDRIASAAGVAFEEVIAGDFADWQWQLEDWARIGVSAPVPPTSATLSQCMMTRVAGWADEDGPLFPNAGDYRTPYQSFCFRIFNRDQIHRAGNYGARAAKPFVSPTGADWPAFQARLRPAGT